MRALRHSPLTERSDLALDVGQGLAGSGFRETVMEGAQSVFKAGLEPVDHVRFHPLPRDRMAPQENLRVGSRVRLLAVDTVPIDGDRAVRCGCDGRGRGVGVEHPGGAAGDHEIDVSLRPHPGEVLLGRDPAVHHDDPALGHVQACPGTSRAVSIVSRVCASTLWPGKVPGKISLNNPRTPQKTAAVEDRTQTFTQTVREREERRIGYGYGAPFLRRPMLRAMLRLRRTRRLTLERGVRQIIERDDRLQVEQGLDRADPMILACLFMFEQMIRRAVQGPVTQGAEVDPQQFSGSAARTVHVRSQAWVALSRSIPRSRLRPPPRAIGLQPVNAARLPCVKTECTECVGTIQPLERRVRVSRSPHARCRPIRTGRASLFGRDWTATRSQ